MKKQPSPLYEGEGRQFPPARTPEEREMQLVMLATDAVEKRIREGTATSQELVYYLKKGSKRDKIEDGIAESNLKLIEAKTLQIEESRKQQELYTQVIEHMKKYSGYEEDDIYED